MAFLICKDGATVSYLVDNREVSKKTFNEKFKKMVMSGREYSNGTYKFEDTEYAYCKF